MLTRFMKGELSSDLVSVARAADAMGRAESARRERQSRTVAAGPRRPAGPASSRSFLSRVLGLPARLAVAALLLAGAGTVAAPASADVLVSNIGQRASALVALSTFNDGAQKFTTGGNASGYTLTSIELQLNSTETAVPTVKVFSGSANGTEVDTLSGPASLSADPAANITFTASGTVTLKASTDYWVVVEGGRQLSWLATTSGSEDATPVRAGASTMWASLEFTYQLALSRTCSAATCSCCASTAQC